MKLVMALLTLIPLAAMADGKPEFGLSGKVVEVEREHQLGAATQSALEQQRRSPPAEKSELSGIGCLKLSARRRCVSM